MQRHLFDFRRGHLAIQCGAERGKIAEPAAGARNLQPGSALDGGGLQIRRQRKIEVAFDCRLHQAVGSGRRVVVNPKGGIQLKFGGLAVLHVCQQHVHVCQLKGIAPAAGIIFYFPDGRVAQGELP